MPGAIHSTAARPSGAVPRGRGAGREPAGSDRAGRDRRSIRRRHTGMGQPVCSASSGKAERPSEGCRPAEQTLWRRPSSGESTGWRGAGPLRGGTSLPLRPSGQSPADAKGRVASARLRGRRAAMPPLLPAAADALRDPVVRYNAVEARGPCAPLARRSPQYGDEARVVRTHSLVAGRIRTRRALYSLPCSWEFLSAAATTAFAQSGVFASSETSGPRISPRFT